MSSLVIISCLKKKKHHVNGLFNLKVFNGKNEITQKFVMGPWRFLFNIIYFVVSFNTNSITQFKTKCALNEFILLCGQVDIIFYALMYNFCSSKNYVSNFYVFLSIRPNWNTEMNQKHRQRLSYTSGVAISLYKNFTNKCRLSLHHRCHQ